MKRIDKVIALLNNAEEFGNDDADTVHDLRMLLGLGPSEWTPAGRDPFHDVRVGDPDPAPGGVGNCRAEDHGYVCTLPIDHGPTHVAGTGHNVVHVWSDR